MQTRVDTEILETIFAHATTAARIAGYIDNATVGPLLRRTINEIMRVVADVLGRLSVPRLVERSPQTRKSKFDVAEMVEELRQVVARADALTDAAASLLDQSPWDISERNRRRFERLAHLIDAAFDAVEAAMDLGDKLALELIMGQTARNNTN